MIGNLRGLTMVAVVGMVLAGLSLTQPAAAGKKRKAASAQNEADAKSYCAAKIKEGTECKVIKSRLQGCGKGWIRGKKFGGKGKDYVACVSATGRKVLTGAQPMRQQKADGKNKMEGCGPIAAGMLFSFWQGKGYKKLIIDSGYVGKDKPRETIRRLMRKLATVHINGKNTATVARTQKSGMAAWIKSQGYKDKLKVQRMQAIRGHEKVMQQLMKNIDDGHPTILLLNGRKADIGGTCTNWHYVLAVGYDVRDPKDKKIIVHNGWADGDRTSSYSASDDLFVEVPFKGCGGKKLNPGLIWVED